MTGENKARLRALHPILRIYSLEEFRRICALKRKRREDKLRKLLWRSIRDCPENFGFKFTKKDNKDIFIACCEAYDYMRSGMKKEYGGPINKAKE